MKIKYSKHLSISLNLLLMASFLYSETKPVEKSYPTQGSPPRKLEQGQNGHWTANASAGKTEGYEIHTVKSGDTLWNITQEYLKDPFLWPQVWEANPNVANPHWIYPGDEILIKKKIVVMAPAAPAPPEQPVAQPAPTEPLRPVPATVQKTESPAATSPVQVSPCTGRPSASPCTWLPLGQPRLQLRCIRICTVRDFFQEKNSVPSR